LDITIKKKEKTMTRAELVDEMEKIEQKIKKAESQFLYTIHCCGDDIECLGYILQDANKVTTLKKQLKEIKEELKQ